MRILLTGAEGFTGRHFAQSACQAGHQTTALTVNLTDSAAVSEQVRQVQPDAVVHLAAISFVGNADDAAFYSVNVLGTMNLLNALGALPRPPSKVLLASSANIYGNCADSPIAEDEPPTPVNHYAVSKLAMEHMARTVTNLPTVIARPFNYTGVGQGEQFLIPKLVDHFARKAPAIELGNLHIEREFNDVRMVCNDYLALLLHGQSGQAYNICTGKTYTLQQVIQILTRLTGHQIQVQVNPAYVRASEVHRLCGSPAKLQQLLQTQDVQRVQPELEQTLHSMLAAHSTPTPSE